MKITEARGSGSYFLLSFISCPCLVHALCVGFHGPNRLPTAEELFSPDEIFVIGGPCFPALWLIVVFWAKSSLV